ncbi:MAG: hypothetical protein HQK86_12050 [Nitrospinae bacterium]|nr:hypothetical protein [Nitrospinota bacterium]
MTDMNFTSGHRHTLIIARSLIICGALVFCAPALKAEAFELPGFGGGQKAAPAAVPAGGEAEKIYNEARRAYGSADYAKVIDLSSKAIAADPKSAKSYALRAKAKKDMGDVDNAMADVNKAVQIDPKLGEAYAIRAQVNEIMGDMKKAEADYATACKNDFKDACRK